MPRALPRRIREVVLAALAPATAACGGSTAATTGPIQDASATIDGHVPGPPLPPLTGDGSVDAPDDAAPDCGSPLDAGLEYAASCCGVNGGSNTCCHGEVCDPTLYPLPSADSGACSPHWMEGSDSCIGGSVVYPCGVGTDASTGYGYPPDNGGCPQLCAGPSATFCQLQYTDGGYIDPATFDGGTAPIVVQCMAQCTGRRPPSLESDPRDVRSVGDVLARAAYLEAASVEAFLRLADEVEAYGCPESLVRRLRKAAGDEVRHARDVGALARARGVTPSEVRMGAASPRSLFAIAVENAREGCVRETWGAACAVVQADRAVDRDVRDAMKSIASDELRHAALAWELAEWLEGHLTDDERSGVVREREQAVADLAEEIDVASPASWRRALGLPSRGETGAVFAAMRGELWDGPPVA